jgi:transposase
MPKHIIDNLPKKDIIQEYTLNHKSAKDISLMYNVSTVTIINLLKQNNIQPTKNKINDDTKQQIIKE